MQLNQTTRNALDLLSGLDDALRVVRLELLAAQVGVGLREARRSMAQLGATGLVVGRRGRTGGYRLARPLEEITLSQVLAAIRERTDTYREPPSQLVQRAQEFLEQETIRARSSPLCRFLPAEAA